MSRAWWFSINPGSYLATVCRLLEMNREAWASPSADANTPWMDEIRLQITPWSFSPNSINSVTKVRLHQNLTITTVSCNLAYSFLSLELKHVHGDKTQDGGNLAGCAMYIGWEDHTLHSRPLKDLSIT